MWRALPILAVAVPLFALTPRTAEADPFTADNTLTITFRSPGYGAQVNALFLDLGFLQVLQPVRGFTASLYDGAELLGTNSLHLFDNFVGRLHLAPSNVWIAPGTPLINLPKTTIDFDAITRGTIDGRIAFTIGAGIIDLNLANVNLRAAQILPGGSGIPATPPTIQDMKLSPVPEPGTLVLALVGAAGAGLRWRRARSRAGGGGSFRTRHLRS